MYVAKVFVHDPKKQSKPPKLDNAINLVPRILSRWDKVDQVVSNTKDEPKKDSESGEKCEAGERSDTEEPEPTNKKRLIPGKSTENNDGASIFTSDLIPFYTAQDVYLRPIYSVKIKVVLPRLRQAQVGQSISNWELKEKIKKLAMPIELTNIKVSQSSLEEVEFIATLKTYKEMNKLIDNLNESQFHALGFTEQLKMTVDQGTIDFPTRAEWDKFFREAKDMDERVPGERPDTVYIGGLPIDWFQPRKRGLTIEEVLKGIMSEYGEIREIDIPQLDPFRKQMDSEISGLRTSWWTDAYFEAYIQYTEYKGFLRAMHALNGKQLAKKLADGTVKEASIKVDFDKTKHLTDKKRVQRELKRAVLQHQEKEEQKRVKTDIREQEENDVNRKKEQEKIARRILREEKRRQKVRLQEQRKLDKIAKLKQELYLRKKLKQKRKEAKGQRKTEAKRLLGYIFEDHLRKVDAKDREEQSKNFMNELSNYIKKYDLDDEDALREKLLRGKELHLRAKMAHKVLDEYEAPKNKKTKKKKSIAFT